MFYRAAVGECSLSSFEFPVGQVPVGRFGKLSGFRKICGLSGVGQAALSDENGLRRFGKKTCRNLFVGNLGLSGSSRLVGGAMLSGPSQGCRVLDTVGSVGEKSLSGQYFKRCRGWLPVGALSGMVGCRALLRQEACANDRIRISWYQTLSRRCETLLEMAGTPATCCRYAISITTSITISIAIYFDSYFESYFYELFR